MDLFFNLVSRCPGVLAIVHRHMFPFVFTWSYQALLALGLGILILIRPKWLNLIVALYLIVIGIIGLVHFHW